MSEASSAVTTTCTDGGTCDDCSNTYDTDVAVADANKCTVADTYVTCLIGVNDACGTTTLADTKTAAAANKEGFCTTGCNQCKSTYDASTKSCTDATTYDTCAKTTCSSEIMSEASTAVTTKCTDGGTCNDCSNTYDTDVAVTDANKCTVAEAYVTCLNGVNDACGTTTLVDTKTAAATKKEEFCTTGCNECKSTYDASAKSCTDATTYDTCAKTTCNSGKMSEASATVTTTCTGGGTCDGCSTTYDTDMAEANANNCTVAQKYVTCLNGVNDDCGTGDTVTALVEVKQEAAALTTEFCPTDCDNCKATYDESIKTCTVAEAYVTCLNGVNDDCGTTTLADAKTTAATKKTEICNSAGSLTVSVILTSLMMAVVSLVRV
ncbi:extracellular matrix protein A [Patella vulgata]|uniref:extracellular matrix protein A n=1 Tax=Patella vulgata TaxID=6465 RepID=UPI00217F5A62|nr:extracellular matrix protein A [Patella vulgata]